MEPHIVAEDTGSQARSDKIYDQINRCTYSFHEMSYVGLDFHKESGFRVPRFNMPYELGLADAAARRGDHELYVFEAKKYRLKISLSDLKTEAQIHYGSAEGVIKAILNVFGRRDPRITPELIERGFSRLYKEYRKIRRVYGWVFDSYCFQECVFLASMIFADLKSAEG